MKIIRTEKEFSKETMPLDFLRIALSLGGVHSSPLKFEEENFIIEECFRGEFKGGSCTPWSDDLIEKGYKKVKYLVRINHNKGFDCFANIFTQEARISGYYKESGNTQYPCSQIDWINLLLEYGFVEIKQNGLAENRIE